MIVPAELEASDENFTIFCSLKATWTLLLVVERDKILFIIPKHNSYNLFEKTTAECFRDIYLLITYKLDWGILFSHIAYTSVILLL